jgi:parvulin-like peptidyl-prolyl isomerase
VGIGKKEYDVYLLFLPDGSLFAEFQKAYDENGGDFEKAAKSLNLSPIHMGFITEDYILPELSSALKNIKEGELSEPIEDPEGRILVIAAKEIRTKTAISQELETTVKEEIRSERANTVFQNWLNRSRQSIVIYKQS